MTAWKATERFWARIFGEERSGPTGRNDCDTTRDTLNIGIEVKHYKKAIVRNVDIAQAERNAVRVGLPWALILHPKGKQHLKSDRIVMEPLTFLALAAGLVEANFSEETIELIQEMLAERKSLGE